MRKNWYRLDTAALIFPVIARRNWSNAFRVSATLKEEIDPALLAAAVYYFAPHDGKTGEES